MKKEIDEHLELINTLRTPIKANINTKMNMNSKTELEASALRRLNAPAALSGEGKHYGYPDEFFHPHWVLKDVLWEKISKDSLTNIRVGELAAMVRKAGMGQSLAVHHYVVQDVSEAQWDHLAEVIAKGICCSVAWAKHDVAILRDFLRVIRAIGDLLNEAEWASFVRFAEMDSPELRLKFAKTNYRSALGLCELLSSRSPEVGEAVRLQILQHINRNLDLL